jgi:hypothetical protein
VIRSTFIPHIEWSGVYWATLVGLFGTTISPYLFFWQASQEVEEERGQGELTLEARKGATSSELRKSRTDVVPGMCFSNLIMYFIILTTAATLHAHGKTTVSRHRMRRRHCGLSLGAGVLALQSGTDRRGHAGCTRFSPDPAPTPSLRGQVARLPSGSRRSLARVLRGHRCRLGAWTRLGLCRLQCHVDAILGSGSQRSAGAAAHRHGAFSDG